MTPRLAPTCAILALAAGCAGQPAAPAAPEAPARPEAEAPAADAQFEEGMTFHVGDLSWTTSTSSTYAFPVPVYESEGSALSTVEPESSSIQKGVQKDG